ncbi:MAG TPA: PQQ-dependent dehydrogenase, methanol/ethanol family [Spongiibacteraceae bacterium]|nr:PQQ-dependent dehydrogenase, methanol/ethanol family [Spongiibacteraceae bacterium]
MKKIGLLLGVSATAALFSACQLPSDSSAPSAPATSIGSGAEWHNVNGDSNETGFSRLDQISASNAGKLGLAWYLDLPGEASLEASPIAVDGMLYFTGAYATVYAVDGASGKLVWKFEPKVWEHNPVKMNFGFGANRGTAYANGKIFSTALDGRLFALDAKTGQMLWSAETTDPKGGQTVTGAPRVFNGKVIIGQGGADFGMRGYVSAYDQATGKQLWRFYVVPASPEQNKGDPAMEAAAKTWNGEFWKKSGGGGGPWDSITFDTELNRIYVGTANAYAYDPEQRSPGGGDNLYTASIVALDADTGKYVWHYQINPRDSWDYDCTQQMTLADLVIDGKPRKVLMQAPKNGFFYVLDRTTGKLISAEKLGKVTWADHIDLQSGRPVENANIRYETGASTIYPFNSGLHSWMRMAYSPATGLVYVPTMQMATRFRRGMPEADEVHVGGINVASVDGEPGDGKGTLLAWDPIAQKARWRVQLDHLWNGGTLATQGNVVFQGAADGWFSAYDATNGARLWRQYAGMGIIAAPMTYAVNGKQYVSVLAGYGGSAAMLSDIMNVGWKYSGPRRLLTYAIDGNATLPASPAPTMTINVQDDPKEKLDPQMVAMGKAMFIACGACHGRNAVGAGGPAPDLRESPIPLNADAFQSIVHDGALIQRGMPRFSYFFDKTKVEALRQYIRACARAELEKTKTTEIKNN